MPAAPPGSLDPTDWDAFAKLAHRLLDEALDYLRTVGERPVWQPVPDAVKETFREPLPVAGPGRRGDRRGGAARDPPLRDRQHPSPLLRLGARLGHRGRPAGRAAGRDHERQPRRPRPWRGLRRAPGDRLVPAAVRLSRGRERPPGQRHLDRDPDRARGRASSSRRLRRPGRRAWPRRPSVWSATPRGKRTAASRGRSRSWASGAMRCARSRSARTTASTSSSSSSRSPPTGASASSRSA